MIKIFSSDNCHFSNSIFFIGFIYVFFSASIFASSSIHGYVKEAQSGQALEGVNVYLSGTLWGSSTNSMGEYIINNIPSGSYEIVVSMIGYETVSKIVRLPKESLIRIDFAIEEIDIVLDSIVISEERPEDWYENLELFKEKFIGKTKFADACRLTNETELIFQVNNNILTAKAINPLFIDNDALGYNIECHLVYFNLNLESNQCTYLIKTKFTEYSKFSESDSLRFLENRREAYEGSIRHLMRSLIKDNWDDNGFWLTIIKYTSSKFKQFRRLNFDQEFAFNKIGNYYSIQFDNRLLVHYKGGRITTGFSLLYDEVIIDEYGYPNTVPAFSIFGDWSKYGVSKLLPRFVFFD